MGRNLIPYDDDALLFIARRFATGDEYLRKDNREAVRCLLHVLRHGSDEARFEAWKIIDSGVVGNRPCFLFFRFRNWADKGESARGWGLPVFWKHWEVAYVFADYLRRWRAALLVVELLLIISLTADRFL